MECKHERVAFEPGDGSFTCQHCGKNLNMDKDWPVAQNDALEPPVGSGAAAIKAFADNHAASNERLEGELIERLRDEWHPNFRPLYKEAADALAASQAYQKTQDTALRFYAKRHELDRARVAELEGALEKVTMLSGRDARKIARAAIAKDKP